VESSAPYPGSRETRELESPLVADLRREDLLEIFRALVRARAAEERLELLFRQGHIGGGLYRSLGQEGASVGAAYALRRRTDGSGDVIAHTIRDTGALFLFGGTPGEYFRQYLARGTSPTRGKEANVHWTDFQRGFVGPVSPLGTMVGVLAGITLSFKIRGEPRVGMVFYGDGASSTGAWHVSAGENPYGADSLWAKGKPATYAYAFRDMPRGTIVDEAEHVVRASQAFHIAQIYAVVMSAPADAASWGAIKAHWQR